ncbi:MAG: S-ribosylhomocysteine lyase [Treponema sp.]|nr:S-ribosylhomocysteine lyase [Treponema sp.]
MSRRKDNNVQSFQIDHERLLPGIYISQKQITGQDIATVDIRMKHPNKGGYLSTASSHTLEHLGATYLRTIAHKDWQERIIYFGPMGCRTGFYLVLLGWFKHNHIYELLEDMFSWIIKADKISGQSSIECGNYLDNDLVSAKKEAALFLSRIESCDFGKEYPYVET